MSEKWHEIRRVFETISELTPEERPESLDRLCGDNGELRREVESLLEADGAASGLFAIADHEPEITTLATELAGTTLGAYCLERKIGEGGMSVVYLARRADDTFQKKVAVKIQWRGRSSTELRKRFRRERQILAALEHPDIARVIDAGTTDDGALYVVMEYVEGLPIDEYCDRHRLTVAERIDLFRRICGAVQFAHQNLVVHRDLKPSNILVDPHGTPRLLDFGIAKLLDPDDETGSPEATAAWLRLMTPSYASPEQARGGRITTASDVYSLGVLLYRLLSGFAPYHLEGLSMAEIELKLGDVEPPPPSIAPGLEEEWDLVASRRHLSPKNLSRHLSGDLDRIVMKAMSRDASRRYESPAALAEDLRRYRAGEPVVAQPDSFSYRAGKFFARHRVAIIAASLAGVLLITFAAVTWLQAERIAAERDLVLAERQKSTQLASFLTALFESRAELETETVSAAEVLDRGSTRIQEELKAQPTTRAAMMLVLGRTQLSLGRFEQAEDLLSRSVVLRRAMLSSSVTDQGEAWELAESLEALGQVHFAQGHLESARKLFQEALELDRRVNGEARERKLSLQGLKHIDQHSAAETE